MVELSLKSGKEPQPPKTIQEKLAELGTDILSDNEWRDRRNNIKERVEKEYDALVGEKGQPLSSQKKEILRMAFEARKIVMSEGVAFAMPGDDPDYFNRLIAWTQIVLMTINTAYSLAPDEIVMPLAIDKMAARDVMLAASFKEHNTITRKTLVVQTVNKSDKRFGGEPDE